MKLKYSTAVVKASTAASAKLDSEAGVNRLLLSKIHWKPLVMAASHLYKLILSNSTQLTALITKGTQWHAS